MSNHLKYPFNPIIWSAVPHDFTASDGLHNRNLGVYTAETTQRYTLGTRCLKWDGRVFRYARLGATLISTTCGLKNFTILVSCRVAGDTTPAAAPVTASIGATKVTVTFTAGKIGDSTSENDAERTGVVAEDELAAGYVHFQTIPVASYEYDENRMIIGNTAVAVGDESMVLYLDEPLNYALLTGTSTCEILASPYANVERGNNPHMSIMGMPNVTGTAGQHIWLQTWGPLRITPTTDTPAGQRRQFVFDDMGAVRPSSEDAATKAYQHAGFLLEATTVVVYWHSPFIMLQISPQELGGGNSPFIFIMEILKRARGDSGEIVPATESENSIKDEVNRRTAKAGYTTKYGECPYRTKIQTTVPFGEQKLNVWSRDENGNLIGE